MPKINDLIVVYPIALIIYLTRLVFENLIAQPIGRCLGIREANKTTHRVSPLAKFTESTWRFTFYLAIFLYGLVVLRNVTKTKRNFITIVAFFSSSLENLVRRYASLLVKLSWTSSHIGYLLVLHDRIRILLVITFFSIHRCETKRFLANVYSSYRDDCSSFVFVHRQFLTCWNISSCCSRLWRLLVRSKETKLQFSFFLFFSFLNRTIFDFQFAKMAKYARAQRLCDILFVIFALVWFLSRLCYYPYK